MTLWFVVAIPPMIMFFALAMERLETRLPQATPGQITPPPATVLDFTDVIDGTR